MKKKEGVIVSDRKKAGVSVEDVGDRVKWKLKTMFADILIFICIKKKKLFH